ncbi:hypothetical protein M405DRAFT_890522 [Rhizopogon salebrosus TDB-379]|nr:hypothetical protein M405DRAFT_890522 [Rhizopogon salebrosus TDB-379]
MSTLQRPPFTVPRHDLSSQPKHRYFLQTRSRIIPLLECTILSYLRFSPHPTVLPLNQGPIHVRRLGTTMLDCIVPFPFEVPTPDLGCVDLWCTLIICARICQKTFLSEAASSEHRRLIHTKQPEIYNAGIRSNSGVMRIGTTTLFAHMHPPPLQPVPLHSGLRKREERGRPEAYEENGWEGRGH